MIVPPRTGEMPLTGDLPHAGARKPMPAVPASFGCFAIGGPAACWKCSRTCLRFFGLTGAGRRRYWRSIITQSTARPRPRRSHGLAAAAGPSCRSSRSLSSPSPQGGLPGRRSGRRPDHLKCYTRRRRAVDVPEAAYEWCPTPPFGRSSAIRTDASSNDEIDGNFA